MVVYGVRSHYATLMARVFYAFASEAHGIEKPETSVGSDGITLDKAT